MKILSCKPKHGSYLSLVLEDGQVLDIHRDIAALYDLFNQTELTQQQLKKLLFDNDIRRVYHRALYLLEGQGYSYKGLFQKLSRSYDEEVCFAVLDRLSQQGFINDWKYAEQVARRAGEMKRYGARRIRQILYQKGIPPAVIEKTLEPYTDEVFQLQNLAVLLEKKYSRLLTDRTDRKQVEKCKAALARMGYDFSVIQKAVRIYYEENASSADADIDESGC